MASTKITLNGTQLTLHATPQEMLQALDENGIRYAGAYMDWNTNKDAYEVGVQDVTATYHRCAASAVVAFMALLNDLTAADSEAMTDAINHADIAPEGCTLVHSGLATDDTTGANVRYDLVYGWVW